MKSKAVACVLRYLLWLVAGVAGTLVLLWCGAAVYFLIAGRDIAPPDLSAYEIPHSEIPPAEDAYAYIRDYARNRPTNLNWRAVNAYLLGTTNRKDCVEAMKDVVAAESNAFVCARGVIVSRGFSTPPADEYGAIIADICFCLRIDKPYRVKATLEAEDGDLAAGRATLMELFRFGKRLYELDEGMSYLIGSALGNIAIVEMSKPLFAPDGDAAWFAELQKMVESVAIGDAEHAKRSIRRTLAWTGARYLKEDLRPAAGCRIVSALKLDWIPGYGGYAFQPNRTLVALKDETERFCAKLDRPYNVEYARRFGFGRLTIPATTEPVNPFARNWFGRKKVENYGFGGSYCTFFRQRFFARSQTVALACRRYRAKHGCYPERLDELVPEFIAAVPLDPFDGKPLRYNNEHHYVWTVGEELAFNGEVDFTSDGKPMWTSTRHRDYKCVRFLSPEGVSDAGAGRPVAYYVPGWLRTGRRSDAPTWTSFTNTFSDARCESFSYWNGNEKWRKSLKNADSQWAMLSRELELMPESVRTNVTLVGHSLGARIVVRTLANLAGKGMKVRQGILLGAAIRNDDPDLQRIGGASVRPVLNLRNPNDVTLKYIYRVAGGEKGPALGVAGCTATNVVDRVVPGDITSETEIAAAWGKVDLLKRIASHHALFYLSALRKGSESPNQ